MSEVRAVSPPRRLRRVAGFAAGSLVLMLHLLVGPALPGCHCRHGADTDCPHEAAASRAEVEAEVVEEGALCHLPPAGDRTAASDHSSHASHGKSAPAPQHDGAPAGAAGMSHCDAAPSSAEGYRVSEPNWPNAVLADAPSLAFEPALGDLSGRVGASSRSLDPPLAPPPRPSGLV